MHHQQASSLLYRVRVVSLAAVFALGLGGSSAVLAQTGGAGATPAPKPQAGTPRLSTPQASRPRSTPTRSTPTKGVFRLPVPPRDFRPPVIEIAESSYNWGSVVRGAIVTHTFQVKNTGGSALIIDRVKPQCGCTAVDKPDKPVPPGGSVPVTLKIDTKRFKGTIKKTARVHSNATAQPLVLTMQGSVEQVYTADPESPRIEVVRGTAAPTGKVTLRRASKAAAKITEVTSPSAVIKPTLKTIEDGNEYEIDIAIDLGQNKRNYFYENLTAKVETGGQVVDIPVRVTVLVKDRIDVSPKSAYFPRKETSSLSAAGAQPLAKTLEIKSLGGPDHKFKITGVDLPESAFKTEVNTVEEGRHYQLVVTLPELPDTKARTLRERITLKTDDPAQPEIKITAMAIFGSPVRPRRPTTSPARPRTLQLKTPKTPTGK